MLNMYLTKKFTIVFLFLMGLFFSPTSTYEDKTSTTLKFESGLNIARNNISNFCKSNIVNKTNKSKSDLDLIISEHRFLFYRINHISFNIQEFSQFANNDYFFNNYIQKIENLSYYSKDIHQLRILLI